MRKLAISVVFLGLAAAAPSFAQEPEKAGEKAAEKAGHEPAGGEEEHGGLEIWKWANFVILAGGLGYLAGKNAGPFFAGRSRQIRKDLVEAQEARKHAEARVAEVEKRMANLENEIAALRADAKQEADAETQRLSSHTAAEMAKIQAHAEQEIAAAGKAARMELKRYSAELAVALAEQKVRARMNTDVQNELVMSFVKDLDGTRSRAQST